MWREWGKGHRAAIAIGVGLAATAMVLFRWSRASAGFWGIDDAGITYAASFELADHGTLAAYVEGTPVESYSNPLVFFVVAALRWLGMFDPVATHVRIEMVLFAAMTLLVWRLLRRLTTELASVLGALLFAALELITPSTWLWYGSGLENLWVSTGIIALIWMIVRTRDGAPLAAWWGALACLVALTRPEAPVFVAGFYVALLACARALGVTWRTHVARVVLTGAVTGILFATFLAWRRIGYGDWLANTYYAKMWGPPNFFGNLRVTVMQHIVPYAHGQYFAGVAIVLIAMRRLRTLGIALVIMLAVSLALPFTAGEDFFMGEVRFGTSFAATSHLTYAIVVAVAIAALQAAPRVWWRAAAAAALAVVPILALRERMHRGDLYLDTVSIGRIAELQGGERWEHQMRVGVPYGVAMLPDVGGALLVGGTQLVDNAYLAEYELAHMGRYFGGSPALLRQTNQYQHEERRPDLVDDSTAIGVIDGTYIGTRYLRGPGHLLARRDLVEVAAIDPAARLVIDDPRVRVYLSPETVPVAGPGGLVRVEVIVAWSDPSAWTLALRGEVDGGDRDQIALQPYSPGPTGIERRALLLGAPARAGRATVTLELRDNDRVVASDHSLALDVTTDPAAALAGILADPSVLRTARRLAWLREQAVPRFGMTRFHVIMRSLLHEDARREAVAGRNVLRLRWNARLAAFDHVTEPVRVAEQTVAQRVFGLCPLAHADTEIPARIACLGRAVDELRRLGYLGVVARAPAIAHEFAHARDLLDYVGPEQRYQLLVGLVFADPGDMRLHRALIAQRRALDHYPDLSLPGVAR